MNTVVARSLVRAPVRTMGQVRTKTSLIPPNVANLKELGRLQSTSSWAHPEKFNKLKHINAHLPKGPRAEWSPKFGKNYYEKYIKTGSPKMVLHFIGGMVVISYYFSYFVGGVSCRILEITYFAANAIIMLNTSAFFYFPSLASVQYSTVSFLIKVVISWWHRLLTLLFSIDHPRYEFH